MNRCKTSLVIREMQIKVTARHRDAPGEAAEVKHHDTTERRSDAEKPGPRQPPWERKRRRDPSCAPASAQGNGPRVHAKGVREGL